MWRQIEKSCLNGMCLSFYVAHNVVVTTLNRQLCYSLFYCLEAHAMQTMNIFLFISLIMKTHFGWISFCWSRYFLNFGVKIAIDWKLKVPKILIVS